MRLLYFSPVAWDSYEQRPHYFVRDFLESGGDTVVWINPYPARLPTVADLWREDLRQPPVFLDRPACLSVIDPGGFPIDPLPGGRATNWRLFWRKTIDDLSASSRQEATIVGIGRPTALALTALEAIRADWVFYDAMDDFPEFYRGRSRTATRLIEQRIVQHAHRIFASSSHLFEKFAGAGAPVTLLRNAYDMALLPPFSAQRPASAHAGFIGCLGGWFDWRAVIDLANARAALPITLVGPRAIPVPRPLPANIMLRPPCTQAEGVRLLEIFTAGLIPFVRTSLTAGVDPIKYYQYRGAGLPILTTRFGEMACHGPTEGTFFLDGAGGLERAIDEADAYRPSEADVAAFRAANTWSARFKAAEIWTRRCAPGT